MPPVMASASSVLAPIGARIQADVGAFLQLEAALLAARQASRDPAQLAALDQLLAEQRELEGELPAAVDAAQRLSAGQLSFEDAGTAADFYARMQTHLARAQDVLGASAPAAVQTSAPSRAWLLWGAGALVGFFLLRKVTNPLVLAGAAVGGYLLWRRVMGATAVPIPGADG
jgi:hypothetical protein